MKARVAVEAASVAMKAACAMMFYNNARLVTMDSYKREQLYSARIMAHILDTASFFMAPVYLPWDMQTTERYLRNIHSPFAPPITSFGALMCLS